jgi:hypothetical protein
MGNSSSNTPKTSSSGNKKSASASTTNGQASAPIANMGAAAASPDIRTSINGGITNMKNLTGLGSIYNPQTGSYRSPYAATYQANGGYKSPYAVGGGFANGYQPNPLKFQQRQQQRRQASPPHQQQQQARHHQAQPQQLPNGPHTDPQKISLTSENKSFDPSPQQRQQQQQQQHHQSQQPMQSEPQRWSQPQNQGQFLQRQYNVAPAQASAEMAK